MSDFKAGEFYRYPDLTGKRVAEGGRRCTTKENESSFIKDPQKPLISIITVVYNGEATLERTMQSVFNQTYLNIEYIIIDGGSKDKTLSIIEKQASKLEYYLSEPDGGIYDAMNKGIRLAKGEYIQLLNADDWNEKKAVEWVFDAILENKGKNIGGYDLQALVHRSFGRKLIRHREPLNSLTIIGMPLCHNALFLKAEVYSRLGGYDTNYKIAADNRYIYKLVEEGVEVVHIPKVGINFNDLGISHFEDDGHRILMEVEPSLTEEEALFLDSLHIKKPEEIAPFVKKLLSQKKLASPLLEAVTLSLADLYSKRADKSPSLLSKVKKWIKK